MYFTSSAVFTDWQEIKRPSLDVTSLSTKINKDPMTATVQYTGSIKKAVIPHLFFNVQLAFCWLYGTMSIPVRAFQLAYVDRGCNQVISRSVWLNSHSRSSADCNLLASFQTSALSYRDVRQDSVRELCRSNHLVAQVLLKSIQSSEADWMDFKGGFSPGPVNTTWWLLSDTFGQNDNAFQQLHNMAVNRWEIKLNQLHSVLQLNLKCCAHDKYITLWKVQEGKQDKALGSKHNTYIYIYFFFLPKLSWM